MERGVSRTMSMYDKSYCATECEDSSCERNIKFNKPTEKIYSASTFDDSNPDKMHKRCPWRIKKGS